MRALALQFTSSVTGLIRRGAGSRIVSGFVTVAMLTVVGKAVSFVKDAAVARQFGTGDALDAFMLSFGLLTFLAALLGGGLPEAFLPVYAEAAHRRGMRLARRLALQASLLHAASLALLALFLVFAGPVFIGWAAQGFELAKRAFAVDLMAQLLPFLLLFGMSYQAATWLRADKAFAVAATAPMLIPLMILGCLAWDGPAIGVHTLVRGTVWGAAAHLAVLLYFLARSGNGLVQTGEAPFSEASQPTSRPSLSPRSPQSLISSALSHIPAAFSFGATRAELSRLIRASLPYLFAGAIFSSTVVVDQTMAAWLSAGSVAVLSYTEKVCGIILAVTAAPACDVLFPYFADKVARADWAGVRRQLWTSAGAILAVALPAVLLLCALAPLVIRILFERGAFTPEDTERVAHVLRFAALQIPFFILANLASRVVVALQATRFILAVSALGLVANAGLNWVLMRHLGVAGIALSTAFVQMMSAAAACAYVTFQIRRRLAAQSASPL